MHVLNYGNFHGDALVRCFTITTSVHLLHTSKTSTSLLTMKLLLCFQQRTPMACVPHLMYQHGRLDVLNIQPGHPTNLNRPYRISQRSGDMLISKWKKCMDSRKEVLGSKRKRRARI